MTDDEVRRQCARWLSHHGRDEPARVLTELAAAASSAADVVDVYGSGGAVGRLEARVATELGKPAALFFIKGVTAQLAVLRMHGQEKRSGLVVLHPQSHIGTDEADALERAAGMQAVRIGRHLPFSIKDLERVKEPVAAVVVELPLRRPGYLLPDLAELEAISAWCRDRGVAFHLDGARLWEAAAGYGVSPAHIAALADTVYVSFYKGLGGLGGAAVAGSKEAIAALAVWKTRFGGDLVTAYPQALSALQGFDRHLPRMREYVERARSLARCFGRIPGVLVNPEQPQANSFQVLLRGTPDELAARHVAMAQRERAWMFGRFVESPLAGFSLSEVTIGAAADAYTDDEAAGWMAQLAAPPK